MVATAFQHGKQSTYLDAPVVTQADVVRLAWWIARLRFHDALVSGSFRLERQPFEQVSEADDARADRAQDGDLVTGTYVEYALFVGGALYGVVEVRVKGRKRLRLYAELATCLLERDWLLSTTKLVEGGALVSANMKLDRVRRLLKG